MASTIPMATYNTSAKIEDEPSPWYLAHTVVDPDTGEILYYKDLIQEKIRDLWKNGKSKQFVRLAGRLTEKL